MESLPSEERVAKHSTALFKTCSCGARLMCKDSRTSTADDLLFVRRRYDCKRCNKSVTTGEFVIADGHSKANNKGTAFIKSLRSQGADAMKKKLVNTLFGSES